MGGEEARKFMMAPVSKNLKRVYGVVPNSSQKRLWVVCREARFVSVLEVVIAD